jgi:aryl carrier-like protein
MVYMGRKDSQAKLNGQRLELEEVAYHLGADSDVRHAIAMLPKSGPCVKRLVAVLSLRQITHEQNAHAVNKFETVTSKEASSLVEKIQGRLRQKLPPYMVPSTWLVLRSIPLLPSGKLDRTGVARFVENMSDKTFDSIIAANSSSNEDEDRHVASPDISADDTLKSIWSQVLNIAPQKIGQNISFLHLGGDSITAMQVMARCRAQGISVAVQDIIGSKSVHELALKAGVPKPHHSVPSVTNEDHHEFDPTPIQQLYFQLAEKDATPSGGRDTQFNQSVLLRLAREVDPHAIGRGLQALVKTHSMLRARFRRDGTGSWRQRITSDINGSYRFKTHVIGNANRMEKRIQNSQRALNIQNGPLLAADLFSIGKEKKEVCVFITIHHLVVDVVSWGILLQDLEDFLATGNIKPPMSLPFQAWSRKQSEQAQEERNGHRLLPHHETADVDLDYWGMSGTPNVQGDVLPTRDIELDSGTTAMLLGPDCHRPLGTEVLDVLLAALLLSYRNASAGRRGAPTIYNEGHGREVGDESLDLSRTVGWFTTLYPVHLPDESSSGKFPISFFKRLAKKIAVSNMKLL